jgi:CRISPR-associated RAMP protein (TIGR02581 family)
MHKRWINQCLIELEIQTEGPLLIKSGAPAGEGPDMSPVVTFRNRSSPEPYIPGSSLKGVIRSHTERIARTLCWDTDNWRVGACNPFLANERQKDWAKPDGYCGVKFQEHKNRAKRAGREDKIPSPVIYRDSCPACKIFGSTFLIGRLSVPDAYLLPDSQYRRERRDGVGIDRFSGGASKGAKFDLEAITNAKFKVQLQMTNFELWQIGLLAYVLRDLKEGLINIGSGKSRGLGQVSARIYQIEVAMAAHGVPQRDANRLWGLAALETDASRAAYDYWLQEREGILVDGAQAIDDALGLRLTYRLTNDDAMFALWRQTAQLATEYFGTHYRIPPMMRFAEDAR